MYENVSQEKSTRFYKVCVHNSPIVKLLFHTKFYALLRRGFSRKFPKRAL